MEFLWSGRIRRYKNKHQKRKQYTTFYCHWDTKVRGANRIRYPGSPYCKLWVKEEKTRNFNSCEQKISPEEYDCKIKI